jgi:hypothetical protein
MFFALDGLYWDSPTCASCVAGIMDMNHHLEYSLQWGLSCPGTMILLISPPE